MKERRRNLSVSELNIEFGREEDETLRQLNPKSKFGRRKTEDLEEERLRPAARLVKSSTFLNSVLEDVYIGKKVEYSAEFQRLFLRKKKVRETEEKRTGIERVVEIRSSHI